jgi:hypothetical protein
MCNVLGSAVTLQQTIKNLEGFDRASTIYAVYPWQPSSNAIRAALAARQ